MTTTDNLNKDCFTLQPEGRISNRTQSTCTESECSTSICVYGMEENLERSEPTNHPELPPDDYEVSSNIAYDEDLYKIKINGREGHFSPAKIEFKRIKSKAQKPSPHINKFYRSYSKKKLNYPETRSQGNDLPELNIDDNTILSRLKRSFSKMQQKTVAADQNAQSPVRSSLKPDPEKIDIYYFDHGNAAYFRTTDCPPAILSEILAQQTTYYATRFWAEIFGSIHIGMTFFLTFFLQTYRFILYSIVRAVIVGFFQMTSDYLLKPFLTVLFNGLLQPVLILIYNLLSSIKDMLEPIAETMENFLRPLALILKSIRLISYNHKTVIYKKQEV